jgi:hypothetical protein
MVEGQWVGGTVAGTSAGAAAAAKRLALSEDTQLGTWEISALRLCLAGMIEGSTNSTEETSSTDVSTDRSMQAAVAVHSLLRYVLLDYISILYHSCIYLCMYMYIYIHIYVYIYTYLYLFVWFIFFVRSIVFCNLCVVILCK